MWAELATGQLQDRRQQFLILERARKLGLPKLNAGEPLAPTEIYSLTKKFVVGEWNLRTDNLSSRRHNFTRTAKTLRPPDRYSAKYVLGIDPACSRCQEPHTAPHMLLHCPNHKGRATTSKLNCTPMDYS
ncbi:hypothetical protein DPMN_026188 [Dreissena polymorpha]|uniref:Reverse transcriptase n=1 Tax=Dreissena polymorpha TaxID=45954 RepID=A0A9D4LSX5_DREPO|nr:hypothetical protein DPMN_026188 [Dreissena polymorpha]